MSEKRERNQSAQDVLAMFHFGSKGALTEAMALIKETKSFAMHLMPSAVGVWAVGRRPIVNGDFIALNTDDPEIPGGLPAAADLDFGVDFTDTIAHDGRKVTEDHWELVVSGIAHFANRETPNPEGELDNGGGPGVARANPSSAGDERLNNGH